MTVIELINRAGKTLNVRNEVYFLDLLHIIYKIDL